MKFQAINLPAGAHDIFLAKPQKGSWICVFQNTDEAPTEYKEVILTTEKQRLTIKTTSPSSQTQNIRMENSIMIARQRMKKRKWRSM